MRPTTPRRRRALFARGTCLRGGAGGATAFDAMVDNHHADRAGGGLRRRAPRSARAGAATDRPSCPRARPSPANATSAPAGACDSTLLHELTHWTGIETRCKQAYAMEQLVAELGAAFLCADLGISAVPRRSRPISGAMVRGDERREPDDFRRGVQGGSAGFQAPRWAGIVCRATRPAK